MRSDFRSLLLGPLCLCVLCLCGCVSTANTPHQRAELRRLNSERHRFAVRYDGDLPIGFTTFGIYVVGPTDNTLGAQGQMESKGSPDALQAALKAKVVDRYPDKADGRAKGLVILFRYRDPSGTACGEERQTVVLGGQYPAVVTLRQIGQEGSPHSIVAEPEAVIWESGGVESEVPLKGTGEN